MASPQLCDDLDDVDTTNALSQLIEELRSFTSNEPQSTFVNKIVHLLNVRIHLQQLYRGIAEWIKAGASSARSTADDNAEISDRQLHITQTLALSQAVVAALEEISAWSADIDVEDPSQELDFAFSSVLVKLMQNSPVRAVELKTFPICINHLKNICAEVQKVCAIAQEHCLHVNSSLLFETTLHQTVDLSAQKMHLVARSLYKGVLQHDFNKIPTLLARSMLARGIPPSLVHSELVTERWLPSISRTCRETLRTLTAHRNRLLARYVCVYGCVSTYVRVHRCVSAYACVCVLCVCAYVRVCICVLIFQCRYCVCTC